MTQWLEVITPLFPSPHSGILFLSAFSRDYSVTVDCGVSVPSFGDSFFIRLISAAALMFNGNGFRPLIRGFFFYICISTCSISGRISVSVPSFGDSFFIRQKSRLKAKVIFGFRPLIRGFFFYETASSLRLSGKSSCFRPLIRGFFFYLLKS